jgi:hypothetical protein
MSETFIHLYENWLSYDQLGFPLHGFFDLKGSKEIDKDY